MAWTAALIAELCARTRAPIFSLERVQLYNEPSLPIALSSHLNRGTSAGADRTAQITRVETQGATLSPRGWTTTIGAFTVTVAGSLKYLMSRLVRGSVVALKIGFAGWEASEFEIIALGQVRQIGGRAPFYQIECYDAYSALRERVTNAVTTRTLFGTTG